MNLSLSTRKLVVLGCAVWLVALGCRVADVVAQGGAVPTRIVTRTVPRPTFTAAPPTLQPTDVPPPTSAPPPVVPTRAPAAPRTPTRKPTAGPPPAPPPAPPTEDPYAGYLYKPGKLTCVNSPNTRIQGTVYTGGAKQDNVWVRVTSSEDGSPAIDDALTGADPADVKHSDPALAGQYRLGLYEGKQVGGTWFVFVLGLDKEAISPKMRVVTSEGPGNNTCTIDFSH